MWPFTRAAEVPEITPAKMPRYTKIPEPTIGRYTALGYESGKKLREIDRKYSGGNYSGDFHERFTRADIIAQSRDFMRNNLMYSGLIDRVIDFAIGSGFGMQAQDKGIDAKWDEYIKSAEVSGRYNGSKLIRALAREWFVTGEGIAKFVGSTGKIQLLESEQCRNTSTDNTNQGITYSDEGRAQSFSFIGWDNKTRINERASNVLFVCNYERPSSQRGMPVLQTAFPMMHRIMDICDSEVLALNMLSRLFLIYKSDSEVNPFQAVATNGDYTISENPYASVVHIGADSDMNAMARDIPGKDFPSTLQTFCRLVGLPLGIPLELIMMDWTKSNFSQTKAALLLSYKRFADIQHMFMTDFYEPLFRRTCSKWRDDGLVSFNGDVPLHKWIYPQYPWIDALAEATAQEKKLALGITTHGDVLKAIEQERDHVNDEREREIIDSIERSNKIEEQYGVKVPWQTWCGISVGKTEQAVVAAKEQVLTADDVIEDDAIDDDEDANDMEGNDNE